VAWRALLDRKSPGKVTSGPTPPTPVRRRSRAYRPAPGPARWAWAPFLLAVADCALSQPPGGASAGALDTASWQVNAVVIALTLMDGLSRRSGACQADEVGAHVRSLVGPVTPQRRISRQR